MRRRTPAAVRIVRVEGSESAQVAGTARVMERRRFRLLRLPWLPSLLWSAAVVRRSPWFGGVERRSGLAGPASGRRQEARRDGGRRHDRLRLGRGTTNASTSSVVPRRVASRGSATESTAPATQETLGGGGVLARVAVCLRSGVHTNGSSGQHQAATADERASR